MPQGPSITQSNRALIDAHYNVLIEIIDFDEPWAANEYEHGPSNSQLGAYSQAGIIQQVDTVVNGGDKHALWRFAPKVREYIEGMRDRLDTPECNHRGIVNLGGDCYTCRADWCDVRFGREMAAEVLSGVTA